MGVTKLFFKAIFHITAHGLLEDKVVSSSPDNQPGVIEEDLSYAKESIAQESAPGNKTQIKFWGKFGTLKRICCYSISRN